MKHGHVRVVVAVLVGLAIPIGPGCGGDRTKTGTIAPVTPEMVRQTEASSNYMMDRMKKNKAPR